MTQLLEVRASSQTGRRPQLDLSSWKPDQTPACVARRGPGAPLPAAWVVCAWTQLPKSSTGQANMSASGENIPQPQAPPPTVFRLLSPCPARFGHLATTCTEETAANCLCFCPEHIEEVGFLSFSAGLILPFELVEGAGDGTRTSHQRRSQRSEQLETFPGSPLPGHTP